MYILLFYEKRSMRLLLKKNLIEHRPRNKLTSLIYSVSLGSIIFLLVSATLQLRLIQTGGTISNADLVIGGGFNSADTDPVLLEYIDSIKDFAYVSEELSQTQNDEAKTCYSDLARLLDSRDQ